MIGRQSRYASSILFTDRDSELLGARTPLDTNPRPDDRFHVLIDSERLDQLADRYLGRAELWWVIADYNAIDWPINLDAGKHLRIPSVDTVLLRLL